ncbi:hypothetical protein J4H86_02905 [Spiractinospora alimapuensis]|uniref:hypothetical protein n=1 Tax=Spiractinospora alimapuensis TaxID=2820884 RepID=UPI001F46FEC3|nr:hypothetical protein [Spiractinospora alimapuensis]QVQ52794.1 hypothetical protein J4H86_02905 [Spiractinospora alimapuensis]
MVVPQRTPRTSVPLPPYHAVLVVDAEKFSHNPSQDQGTLHNMLRDALRMAFEDADLTRLWENASFPQSTGDGYIVGVEPAYLPFLIHPLMDKLQSVLDEMQPSLAYANRSMRLRLRAAIGVGPLPNSGGARNDDGIGAAMNETHRILNSPALYEAMNTSDPETTLVAVGLTQRVFEDAVLSGCSGVRARLFTKASADLPNKGFSAPVYVYVPRPSPGTTVTGTLATPDAPPTESGADQPEPVQEDTSKEASSGSDGSTNNNSGTVGNLVQGRDLKDVTLGDRTETHHHGGIGGINGNVETAFGSVHGPVNTGSGDQVNHPKHRRRDDEDTAS